MSSEEKKNALLESLKKDYVGSAVDLIYEDIKSKFGEDEATVLLPIIFEAVHQSKRVSTYFLDTVKERLEELKEQHPDIDPDDLEIMSIIGTAISVSALKVLCTQNIHDSTGSLSEIVDGIVNSMKKDYEDVRSKIGWIK